MIYNDKAFVVKFSGTALLFSCMIMLAVLLSSCGDSGTDETNHPLFVKSLNLKKKKDYAQAARLLEEYLRDRPDSPKARLELATIYDDDLNDPLSAIYHYRVYLEKYPDSPDAENIQKWCAGAEKEFVESLGMTVNENTRGEIENLKNREKENLNRINRLEKENAYLKKKLNLSLSWNLSKEYGAIPAAAETSETPDKKTTESSPVEHKKNPETYKVKSYDTLMRISREIYGDSKYYKQIFEANRDILTSETSLMPGQVLKIPKIKDE